MATLRCRYLCREESEQDIPSRKRAEYRRRYALFDEVACQINDVLAGSLPLSINLSSRT
nr:DUF535 family protein [Pectobacterium colocasium]